MEYLHAKVWIFLVINSCHQNTWMLWEGSSSQVGRGVLQNCMHLRRGGLTEIDAPYCDVLVALSFLFLQDGLIPSFPLGFCLFDAAQQTLLSGMSSLIGWFRVRLQQFLDPCNLRNAASVNLFWAAWTSTWASSSNLLASSTSSCTRSSSVRPSTVPLE